MVRAERDGVPLRGDEGCADVATALSWRAGVADLSRLAISGGADIRRRSAARTGSDDYLRAEHASRWLGALDTFALTAAASAPP